MKQFKYKNYFSFFCSIFSFLFLTTVFLHAEILFDSFEYTRGRGLVIRSSPTGVRVFIDGVERGITPFYIDTILNGYYHIRLSKDGFADKEFNVSVHNGSQLSISIAMEGERGGLVFVSVSKAEDSPALLPFNPQIITGRSSDVSLSPVNTALVSLPLGHQTIRVRAFGWIDEIVGVRVNDYNTSSVNVILEPAPFELIDRSNLKSRRFNPMNSGNLGQAEYHFDVSAPGAGTLTVRDRNNTTVYKSNLMNFNTWYQSASWDGRDFSGEYLPEGRYTVIIEGTPLYGNQAAPRPQSLFYETEINYSINIYPLPLSSGFSGLTFTPSPHVLPAASFQIDSGLLFGNFLEEQSYGVYADESGTLNLPFMIGIRVSPFSGFEIASVFDLNPNTESTPGTGITVSVKYKFFDNIESFPLSFAAGISYAWAGDKGEAPLSSGSGIAVYIPFALALSDFSVYFSPGLFFRERRPNGAFAEAAPELLLSAGVLYDGGWFNAGFSLRCEIDFSGSEDHIRFYAGADWRIYPAPSNLFFFLQAGTWIHSSIIGGYGGLGLGVIY